MENGLEMEEFRMYRDTTSLAGDAAAPMILNI